MKMQIFRPKYSGYQHASFADHEKKVLRALSNIEYQFNLTTDIDSLDLKNPTILLTNTDVDIVSIPQKVLDTTKLLIHPNSGHNSFTVPFIQNANFPIIVGNKIRAEAVASYIITSLHNHYSHIDHYNCWDTQRRWDRRLLKTLNVFIIGMGHIGKIVKSHLEFNGASMDIYDPYVKGFETFPDSSETLKSYDAIILCCGLNEKNHHLIDQQFLNKLKEDVLIINPARGGLIDTKALYQFLNNNPKSYAIIDVFSKEPFEYDLRSKAENIIATCHIAGIHDQLSNDTIGFEKEVILNFMNHPLDQFKQIHKESLLENNIKDGILI